MNLGRTLPPMRCVSSNLGADRSATGTGLGADVDGRDHLVPSIDLMATLHVPASNYPLDTNLVE